MSARVRVPASSSNLGSGFDCVGIAIDRWLVASATLDRAANGVSIRRRGTLHAVRVRGDQDLFTRGFRAACAARGVPPGGVSIDAASDIPIGCGLGSSAAAIVAGVLLADAAFELGLSRAQILEIGTTIEGHPDNIAPAIYGGAVLSVHTPSGLVASPLQVALAWLLKRSKAILPIPGTSSVAHLEQNIAAANLTMPNGALGGDDVGQGNSSAVDGGGLYNAGTATLSNVLVRRNAAAHDGGGIATIVSTCAVAAPVDFNRRQIPNLLGAVES